MSEFSRVRECVRPGTKQEESTSLEPKIAMRVISARLDGSVHHMQVVGASVSRPVSIHSARINQL